MLHGWENFEVSIIKEGLTSQEAYDIEPQMIIHHNTRIPIGYNITAGGPNGRVGMTYTMSPEHKQKISEAHKGKTHTEETKQKLRTIKGTSEYKQRHRESCNTETHKQKIILSRQLPGKQQEMLKRQTEEYRQGVRTRMIGISHTKERTNNQTISLLLGVLQDIDNGIVRGVTVDKRSAKRPYIARTRINGTTKYIGCFATQQEAILAYRRFVVDFIASIEPS